MKIVIADDHPLFRSAVAHALREITGALAPLEASSLRTLEDAVHAQAELDLVLLDLHMPGARGFSSLVFLRSERPEVPVIVISSNDHPRTIRRAQQFGAAGFIPKSAPVGRMLEAVRTVLDGGVWFPPLAAEKSEDDARLAARLAQLTPQQVRVLMCLADGLLNKQIAYELGLAENTVKVHVTAILRKLDCHSRTQAALLVKALEPDPPPERESGDSGAGDEQTADERA
ncbi:LuxR C-terminal-related transcriptional regulator [Solimonas flava]|uniref:LuxR C-terminal-related transcriptional regulator n=1 Tax=Solimonas flava TaxID=415849 RepID=UPI0003FF67CD|nr:response regulator transcription factor [Solimonas flava]